MNIYAKLADARVSLQESKLSKSGENGHMKFKYYELQDFLPSINMINKNLGLISLFSFEGEEAVLTIADSEEDKTIVFKSKVAEAKLQGKPSPIQELGSMHTYMRRYMYMLAYEIVSNDTIDSELGKPLTAEELEQEKLEKAEERERKKKEKELEVRHLKVSCKEMQDQIGLEDAKVKQLYGDVVENLELIELRQFSIQLNKKIKQLKANG